MAHPPRDPAAAAFADRWADMNRPAPTGELRRRIGWALAATLVIGVIAWLVATDTHDDSVPLHITPTAPGPATTTTAAPAADVAGYPPQPTPEQVDALMPFTVSTPGVTWTIEEAYDITLDGCRAWDAGHLQATPWGDEWDTYIAMTFCPQHAERHAEAAQAGIR